MYLRILVHNISFPLTSIQNDGVSLYIEYLIVNNSEKVLVVVFRVGIEEKY